MGDVYTIVGPTNVLALFDEAAAAVRVEAGDEDAVRMSEPRDLDATGEGHDFPIDLATALEGLQVMSLALSSTVTMIKVIEMVRKKRGPRTGPVEIIVGESTIVFRGDIADISISPKSDRAQDES